MKTLRDRQADRTTRLDWFIDRQARLDPIGFDPTH